MKRNQLFALILALCLLLAGCGGNGDAAPETTVPTETVEEKPVTLGVWDGYAYTNSYAGFGYTLDESWDIYKAEELQDLSGIVEEMFEGTDLEDSEYASITDFLAENVTDLTTMNMNYTKLSMQERLSYAMMDDEELIDLMLDNYYDTLVESYANAGIAVESIDKKPVTFLGQERVAMYTVASAENIPYYILQLYDYGLGAYGVTLTLGSYVEDNTEGLLELYYVVE